MFIDANIFLEMALKDKKSLKCQEFIKELVKKRINLYTSDFILYSCLLNICNKLNSLKIMKNFIIFINSLKITIIRPSLREVYDSIDLMERHNLDFDDSLVVSCMKGNNIHTLISYDSHFNNIKEINIIKP